MNNLNCILCGSISYKFIVDMNLFQRLYSILINDGTRRIINRHKDLKYAYCLNCGLIYQKFPPTDDCLGEFYKSWRSYMDKDEFKRYTDMKVTGNLLRIKWMEEGTDLFSLKGRMLDVGTADGSMCELFRKRGWESYGVEQTKEMVKYSKMFYKDINIIDNDYNIDLFPSKYFDFISFSNSLEHFRNPFDALDICSYHLKEDGYLYVEVPTFMSSNFREFISTHFYIFTKNTLPAVLRRRGFEIKKIGDPAAINLAQPYLAVLCQRNNTKQIYVFTAKINFKKEYKIFRRIVINRYIRVFIFTPIGSLLKRFLKLILSDTLYQKLRYLKKRHFT